MDHSPSYSESAFVLCFVIFCLVTSWRIFVKAGQPGWGVLVPFYRDYLWVTMAGKEWWWFILLYIPIVGWIVSFIVTIEIGKRFGHSTLFSILLLFLFPVGFLVLAYGNDQYGGGGGGGETDPTPEPQIQLPIQNTVH